MAVAADSGVAVAGGKRHPVHARFIGCNKSNGDTNLLPNLGIVQVALQAYFGFLGSVERGLLALHGNNVMCTMTGNTGRRRLRSRMEGLAVGRSQEILCLALMAYGAGGGDIGPVRGRFRIACGTHIMGSMAGLALRYLQHPVNALFKSRDLMAVSALDRLDGFRVRYGARIESCMAVDTSQ